MTEELALWPDGAAFERGDFDWRVSRAAVDEAGPFSAFPGFERVLVVTSGAGLRLQHGAAAPRVRVERLRPHRFSGDWPTSATLLQGAVADFNVLARRGVVRAEVSVLRPGPRHLHVRELAGAGHSFVHVLSGTVTAQVTGDIPGARAGAAGETRLAERESLWLLPASPALLELGSSDAACVVLLVQLEADDAARTPRGG